MLSKIKLVFFGLALLWGIAEAARAGESRDELQCPKGSHRTENATSQGCVQYTADGREIRVGSWRVWYGNGQLRSQTAYVNGQVHGLRMFWDENGEPDGMSCFVHGERRALKDCNELEGVNRNIASEDYHSERVR